MPRERTHGTARDFAAAGLVVGALIGGREVAVGLADALVVVAFAGVVALSPSQASSPCRPVALAGVAVVALAGVVALADALVVVALAGDDVVVASS